MVMSTDVTVGQEIRCAHAHYGGRADILAVERRRRRRGSLGGNRCGQQASRNRQKYSRATKHASLPLREQRIIARGSSSGRVLGYDRRFEEGGARVFGRA